MNNYFKMGITLVIIIAILISIRGFNLGCGTEFLEFLCKK